MKISAIVPFYNSEETLRDCLECIHSAEPSPNEVILIDDCSTDASASIAENFPFKIIHNDINRERSICRNIGKDAAEGDIIVFIDSDVLIDRNVFGVIRSAFEKDPSLAGLSGIPGMESTYSNFSSRFKALYMNFVLTRHSGPVEYAHGCIQAYRADPVFGKDGMEFKDYVPIEDIQFGLALCELGEKILLTSQISFVHKRYYSLLDLVKNDFLIPYKFAFLILAFKKISSSARKGSFAHASLLQTAGLGFACLFLFSIIISTIFGFSPFSSTFCLVTLVGNLLCNFPFIAFLYKHKGLVWTLKASLFNLFDQIIMACGMMCGTLGYFLRKSSFP